MSKITFAYIKENSYFDKAKKAYPILCERISEYDYWIRRNSLFSTPGILLLIQGIISVFWSYIIRKLYAEHYYDACGTRIQQVLNYHSFLIIIGNVLVLVLIVIMAVLKIVAFLMGNFHPNILIKLANLCYRKKYALKKHIYFIENK
jgi:hypothetical protein